MEYFKLKEAAKQFFKKDFHTSIAKADFWETNGIHVNLLEKADLVSIFYGINNGKNFTLLKGWTSNDGSPFLEIPFTIRVLDVSHDKYEKINVSALMATLQIQINSFFKQNLD